MPKFMGADESEADKLDKRGEISTLSEAELFGVVDWLIGLVLAASNDMQVLLILLASIRY